jgi:hypothetical protein
MDNIQNCDSYINIPQSQTYRIGQYVYLSLISLETPKRQVNLPLSRATDSTVTKLEEGTLFLFRYMEC